MQYERKIFSHVQVTGFFAKNLHSNNYIEIKEVISEPKVLLQDYGVYNDNLTYAI